MVMEIGHLGSLMHVTHVPTDNRGSNRYQMPSLLVVSRLLVRQPMDQQTMAKKWGDLKSTCGLESMSTLRAPAIICYQMYGITSFMIMLPSWALRRGTIVWRMCSFSESTACSRRIGSSMCRCWTSHDRLQGQKACCAYGDGAAGWWECTPSRWSCRRRRGGGGSC